MIKNHVGKLIFILVKKTIFNYTNKVIGKQ